jgi:UDP-glucose 4-epimerase
MLTAFEKACGKKIPCQIVARRPGDIAASYADPGLAQTELGWSAQRDIDRMCLDTWHWQTRNPDGYN